MGLFNRKPTEREALVDIAIDQVEGALRRGEATNEVPNEYGIELPGYKVQDSGYSSDPKFQLRIPPNNGVVGILTLTRRQKRRVRALLRRAAYIDKEAIDRNRLRGMLRYKSFTLRCVR